MVASRTHLYDPDGESIGYGDVVVPGLVMMTESEAWIRLDSEARNVLGIGAAEYLDRVKQDAFKDDERDAANMLMLLVPRGRL